ncbi:uncharacterized protein M421DRAFT_234232 [Didymella exigua CBS 183.55]|uniref:Hydrophobin n=1 Tax=Didymella exigua CBS 183.55 TaxID=1150837 RepID=A0A6A5RJ45_9PLEO|nr:uncharacterized protein M421DRAFT_234232 [Didymella exigua CBS 183.55]KAF1925627.1 hypothetical protein M421DRAFT_234232 [Didymella exigua CBS 183.55]
MRLSCSLVPVSLTLLSAVSAYNCGTTIINQLPNIGLGLNSGILGKTLARTPVCCKEPGTVILGVDDNCRRINPALRSGATLFTFRKNCAENVGGGRKATCCYAPTGLVETAFLNCDTALPNN